MLNGILKRVAAPTLALMIAATASFSASVTVIGDVNADANDAATHDQLYTNILGTGSNVLFSRDVGTQQDDTRDFYNGLAGVTATENPAMLSDTLLSGVDLLVITSRFNTALSYAASELTAVSNFIAGGGDVLLVLEAAAGAMGMAPFDSFNSVLAGIGSSIRYTKLTFTTAETDAELNATDISDASQSFRCNACSLLSGGEAVAQVQTGGTFVAYEDLTPVPLPGTLPLLAAGGLGLLVAGRKRRRV